MEYRRAHFITRPLEQFEARVRPDGAIDIRLPNGEEWICPTSYWHAEGVFCDRVECHDADAVLSTKSTEHGLRVQFADGEFVLVCGAVFGHDCLYQTNDVGIYHARGVRTTDIDGHSVTRDVPLAYLYDACGHRACEECNRAGIFTARRVAYDVPNRVIRVPTARELAAEAALHTQPDTGEGGGSDVCVIAPSDPRRLTDTWAVQRGTCRAEEHGTEVDLRAIESRCKREIARANGWRGYPHAN